MVTRWRHGALALALLLLPALAHAQGVLTTVQMHLQEPNGGPITSGTFARFTLLYCGPTWARVLNTTTIPVSTLDVPPDPTGLVSTQLYGNDQITCHTTPGTTRWSVQTFVDNNPNPALAFYIYQPANGSIFNLDIATPDDLTLPIGVIFSNPPGNQTLAQPANTSLAFQGNVDFTGANVTGINAAIAGVSSFNGLTGIVTYVPAWTTITGKPSVFPSDYATLINKPTAFPSDWSLITSKPTNFQADWNTTLINKPATFPPSAHTHDAADIVSGTLSTLRIPNLDVAKITTGTFATSFIPSLDAAKITTGIFAAARLPLPGLASVGAINAKDCSAVGNAVTKLNTDGTVTCGAITASISALTASTIGGIKGAAAADAGGSFKCSSTDKIVGFNADGTFICGADQTGSAGTGITSLGGQTGSTQTFAAGSAGTDFAISSATNTHTFNLPTASATNRGALSSADWSTFNGKENALTFSAPLSRSSNTISVPVATSSQNGYLASADWTTFNNKQAALAAPLDATKIITTVTGSKCVHTVAGSPPTLEETAADCGTGSGGGGASSGLDCSLSSGADWGAKLSACITAVSGTGLVADGSKLSGTLATTVTLSQSNYKVVLNAETLTFAADTQLIISGSDLTVEGIGDSSLLTAPSAGAVSSPPVKITGSRVILRNLRVEGNRVAAPSTTKHNIQVGDSSNHPTDVHLLRVTSNNASAYGIALSSCQHCSVEDGSAKQNGRSGVLISETSATPTFDILVKGNKLIDNEQANTTPGGTNCILSSRPDSGNYLYDITVDHNYCALTTPGTSGFGAGIQLNGPPAHLRVTDNIVDGATHEAISFTASDIRVARNIVRNSVSGGILAEANGANLHDVYIEDNTVYDNPQYGIKLHLAVAGSTPANISIRRNRSTAILATQNHGILINNDAGGGSGNTLTGVYIESNLLSGNTVDPYSNACAANCTGTPFLFDNDGLPVDFLADPTGSTTSAPRQFGFNPDMSGTQAVRFEVGGVNTGLQNAVNNRVQMYSNKPIEIRGNTNSGSAAAFTALSGSPTAEPSLAVITTLATAPGLTVIGAPSQSADFFQVLDSTLAVKLKVQSTGNVVAGSGDGGTITTGRFISSQATGTAPLTVASTTKVTNLNADQVDGFSANQVATLVWTDIVNWGNGGVGNYSEWTPTKLIKLKTIEVKAQLVGSAGTCTTPPAIDIFQNGVSITGSTPISVPINGTYASATLNIAVTDLTHPLVMRLTAVDNCTNHTQFIHTAVAYEMNQ